MSIFSAGNNLPYRSHFRTVSRVETAHLALSQKGVVNIEYGSTLLIHLNAGEYCNSRAQRPVKWFAVSY